MIETRIIQKQKHIALIAHDHKKLDLLAWVEANKHNLIDHHLYATGTTGKLIEENLQHEVHKFKSGSLGGDQEIGAYIANGKIDVMIFFWDPMEMQPHDSDVHALMRLGSAWNIPIATDKSTADFLINSSFWNEEYTIQIPDYSNYLQRTITK